MSSVLSVNEGAASLKAVFSWGVLTRMTEYNGAKACFDIVITMADDKTKTGKGAGQARKARPDTNVKAPCLVVPVWPCAGVSRATTTQRSSGNAWWQEGHESGEHNTGWPSFYRRRRRQRPTSVGSLSQRHVRCKMDSHHAVVGFLSGIIDEL